MSRNDDHLIYLFSFGETDDTANYVSASESVYINDKTGKLFRKYCRNSVPPAFHYGSADVSTHEISYDRYREILATYNIKNSAKFKTLREDNWQEWLIGNKFI